MKIYTVNDENILFTTGTKLTLKTEVYVQVLPMLIYVQVKVVSTRNYSHTNTSVRITKIKLLRNVRITKENILEKAKFDRQIQRNNSRHQDEELPSDMG